MSAKYAYAGFWVRFAASLIDSIIMGFMMLPIAWIFYQGDFNLVFATGESASPQILWFDWLLNYILPFLYSIVGWVWFAGTPGKRLLNLKVLDAATGNPISLGQAVLRYLGYIPSAMVFLLGFFWIAFDAKKQGWHDKMAKTVVVREL